MISVYALERQHFHIFLGDRPNHSFLYDNPIIDVYECDRCHARLMGSAVLFQPVCPRCRTGVLNVVNTWNLATQGWPEQECGGVQ